MRRGPSPRDTVHESWVTVPDAQLPAHGLGEEGGGAHVRPLLLILVHDNYYT